MNGGNSLCVIHNGDTDLHGQQDDRPKDHAAEISGAECRCATADSLTDWLPPIHEVCRLGNAAPNAGYTGGGHVVAAASLSLGVGVFAFLWFLGMGGLAVASGLLREPRPGESGPLADILLGLGLWVVSIMPFIMMRSYLRTHREKDPHVAVGPEDLTIFHSAVFVDPQLIPGDMIQKIVVGPGVTRELSRIRPLGGEAPVVLSAHAETPNALMVFTGPTVLDRAYVAFTAYRNWIGRPPSCKQPVKQVWLAFHDAADAYGLLRQWGPTEWDD